MRTTIDALQHVLITERAYCIQSRVNLLAVSVFGLDSGALVAHVLLRVVLSCLPERLSAFNLVFRPYSNFRLETALILFVYRK